MRRIANSFVLLVAAAGLVVGGAWEPRDAHHGVPTHGTNSNTAWG